MSDFLFWLQGGINYAKIIKMISLNPPMICLFFVVLFAPVYNLLALEKGGVWFVCFEEERQEVSLPFCFVRLSLGGQCT
jgi:hypothetical protein